jgi:hypothetical protein
VVTRKLSFKLKLIQIQGDRNSSVGSSIANRVWTGWWKNQGSIPGRGNTIFYSPPASGPALDLTILLLIFAGFSVPGIEAARAWSWPLTYLLCRGLECVEIYYHARMLLHSAAARARLWCTLSVADGRFGTHVDSNICGTGSKSRDSSLGTVGYGLHGSGSILGREKVLLFSVTSRPALGPTQPPIQWVLWAVSPRVKRHLHIVSRSRMMELYLHFPHTTSWSGA